jgi:hypothetical protein
MPQLGEIKTNPNNPAQKARWDGGQWVDASAPVGPKSAPAWGQGAVELPDGSVVRYGPRGGAMVLKRGKGGEAPGALPDLTEDQGKQTQNAILMADGEDAYRNSLDAGYNPGTVKNSFASWLEGLPFGVGTGTAAAMRDPVGDRGRAAQLRWAEGSLRSRTGAAVKDDEIAREANMFYPGFGKMEPETVQEFERSRAGSFGGVSARAGPGRAVVPEYPYTAGKGQSRIKPQIGAMTTQQRSAASRFKGTKAPSGTQANPSIPVGPKQYEALPRGSYFIDFDGQVVRKN